MSLLQKALSIWHEDNLLRRVVHNSTYLFSSNAVSAMLSFVQGVLATRLLGIEGFGLVSGTIIVFAGNINNLLSFRMSDVVVKYLGEALAQENKPRAAAVVKGSALAEGLTSVFAYLALLALTPWAAKTFGKDASTAPWFAFYGLVLLVNLVYETSSGTLRAAKRFDSIARLNLGQSVITVGGIGLAFILRGGIPEVLSAYLFGKAFGGIGMALLANREMRRIIGAGWTRTPLRLLTDWQEMTRFAVSTNLNATVNLLVRDSAPLWLAAFRSQAEVGYFKLAQNLTLMAMMPIDLFIWPTYSEIVQTITLRQWSLTRRLLKRVSGLAALYVGASAGILALLGWWFIPLLYKPQAAPAYPALLILLAGYGFANIFNWNRPLLLALGRPGFPLVIMTLAGLGQIVLVLLLVPRFGYLAHAALLSAFFVVSIGIILGQGLRLIRQHETAGEST